MELLTLTERNMNALIHVAHHNAKAMGWWDKERNTGELLMLIVSECGEALEAHRSGKFARLEWMEAVIKVSENVIDGIELPDGRRFVPGSQSQQFTERELFESHIKDSFEDELADIVIRIADLCGSMGWDEEVLPGRVVVDRGNFNVGAELLWVTYNICNVETHPVRPIKFSLFVAVSIVSSIAEHMNIDLWRHIQLKLEYNKTRGIRHGKAY